ncbi:uncharacterized protein BX663DRAFT_527242 [Cokeromyces recurvatus]|uniref:uncharacterized protein n=1 Tax=Cokeromyces recurvatus TaxID=90255 RepID=UPI00221E7CA6|nr:uncharacterized protein BX663DRAFT_527242 [Cokeromyces recurvatus]KAI7897696.1 hypothetical protein BX663DRAFT_527242 [Cokeromyces recurvatus]
MCHLFKYNNMVYNRFFILLFQKGLPIIIPISRLYQPTELVINSPKLAIITSVLSIFMSIFTLVLSSRIQLCSQQISKIKEKIPLKYTVIVTVLTGSIAPIMSLDTTLIEFIFWSIPFMLSIMYYISFYMINQVYEGLDELEGSKYKYKGA